MSQPTKIPEPSIDEILASIRRSIVPDGADKPTPRKPASRRPAAAASAPSSAKGRRVDDERASPDAARDKRDDNALFDGPPLLKREARLPEGEEGPVNVDKVPGDPDQAAARGIAVTEATDSGAGHASAPDVPLLSPQTAAAVDTAFNSLANIVQSQNPQNPRTLEDLVHDMLKPMLKAWLDANLPDIVERLVRAEIERVSRRG